MNNELFGGVGTFANTSIEPANRAVVESLIVNNLLKLDESSMKTFLESEKAKAMVEAGILREGTVDVLSNRSDLDSQMKLVCLQLAADAKDTYSQALTKIREDEAELVKKILIRYSDEAKKMLSKVQKEYSEYVTPTEIK